MSKCVNAYMRKFCILYSEFCVLIIVLQVVIENMAETIFLRS